jgi:hypothetical protein
MGSATSQKSFLNIKVIVLLVSLFVTGSMMRYLSPPQKLDSRPYYSFEQASLYLNGLSEIQKENYLRAEYFDFWFLFNYSWLTLLAFKKYLPRKKLIWLAFIPGMLDLFETGLITWYLASGSLSLGHRLLPFLSSCKWLSGVLITLYLCKTIFWRKAKV